MDRRARRTARALALAVVTVVGAAFGVGAAGSGPDAARAMGPLPACRYDDILTTPRRYVDWSTTLVDTILRVPSSYAPPDLVPVGEAGLAGVGLVRQIAIADLTDMTTAAKANGTPIAVQSAYRSYSQQQATFDHWVSVDGYQGALKVSARPGHSEHQLGLAIDFRSDQGGPPWDGSDWAQSPAGAWMFANAWRYGWVLSYPRNDFSKVCYSYEPWHYRYVGKPLAKQIHDSRLTVREYLWANFTTATVPPPTTSTPKPTARPRPSASPLASETPAPSPIALPTTLPSRTLPAPVAIATGAPGPPPTPAPSAEPVSDVFGGTSPTFVAAAIVAVVSIVLVLMGYLGQRRRRGRSGG